MNYKISIIIPVYRVEKYIERCCRSLFGMRFSSVEFLFVDDATPDRSIAIIKSVLNEYPHRQEHVKILVHNENKGVACARNTGLEVATGKYIGFVDADDWVEENMFEKMYQTAEQDNLDIVGCDWYMEFESSRRYMRQPIYTKVSDCLRAMLTGEMRWFLWAFLIRRDVYVENDISFVEGANIGEDMAVLIQFFGFARTYRHVPEALYHYIKSNTASMTALSAKKQIDIVKTNVRVVENFIHTIYHGQLERELDFLKLNVKFPLLISAEVSCYEMWNACFPEANNSIWKNNKQSFRNKCLQWAAVQRCYLILKIYYRYVFKFVYGILYK